ncbi:hypothetical protein ACVDG3_18600 [Meridianimarinicoccus sp. RP-17]|uniref:hypothetical protein n=1 Tax=Meridianimarinicoccus zhengii TaxID=2056810 RepID=UPI000DAF04AD|nr:hypothetical protein [Phycocomes zhengii]
MTTRCEARPRTTTCARDTCDALGPHPMRVVAALADLGLTDPEIAGYFRIRAECITEIRLTRPPASQLDRAGRVTTRDRGRGRCP